MRENDSMSGRASHVVIVGAGLAGLYTALKLAPCPVTVISAQRLGDGSSSGWAQGGIAAAVAEGDTPEAHAADTVHAGAGIVNAKMAQSLAREAAERVEDLMALGVPLDRDAAGRLAVSREAAHSAERIVHVGGDQAGKAVMQALIARVRQTPSIRVFEEHVAEELVTDGASVAGVRIRSTDGAQSCQLPARAVVLATGGIGGLYAMTTNPALSRGEGLAMAARAGAMIGDAEFVQFHPTGIDIGRDPAPLATEALRGRGAILVNGRGDRFMPELHPDAELAPRDVVARAVHREVVLGQGAYLDCRAAIGERIAQDFPAVYTACHAAGIEPARDLIPVAPAAHYHMGGVWTDGVGRTSVAQLWACGEVACNGVHGANRLASNSLLEALVMGARIANDISGFVPGWRDLPPPTHGPERHDASANVPDEVVGTLRHTMSQHVGMERSRQSLLAALRTMNEIERERPHLPALANLIAAARLITASALLRTESRGSHYRSDHPASDETWRRHSLVTLKDVERLSYKAAGAGTPEPRLSA